MFLNSTSAGRTSDNGRRNGGSGPKPCRRIQQLVASAHGDRSAKIYARFWCRIPERYRQDRSVSNFWKSDRPVFERDPVCGGSNLRRIQLTGRSKSPAAIWLT